MTIRLKPASDFDGKINASWAFVSFVDEETATAAESGESTLETGGESVTLKVSAAPLAWTVTRVWLAMVICLQVHRPTLDQELSKPTTGALCASPITPIYYSVLPACAARSVRLPQPSHTLLLLLCRYHFSQRGDLEEAHIAARGSTGAGPQHRGGCRHGVSGV